MCCFKCVDFEYWQFHTKLMANHKIAPQAETLLHKQLRGEHLWNYAKDVYIINKAAWIQTKIHSVSEKMKRQQFDWSKKNKQNVTFPQRLLSGPMDIYCGRTSEILVSTGSGSHTGWFTLTPVIRWVSPVPVWALHLFSVTEVKLVWTWWMRIKTNNNRSAHFVFRSLIN